MAELRKNERNAKGKLAFLFFFRESFEEMVYYPIFMSLCSFFRYIWGHWFLEPPGPVLDE